MRAGVAAHTGWLTLSGPQASARKRGDGKYVIRLYRVLLLTESCVLYSSAMLVPASPVPSAREVAKNERKYGDSPRG